MQRSCNDGAWCLKKTARFPRRSLLEHTFALICLLLGRGELLGMIVTMNLMMIRLASVKKLVLVIPAVKKTEDCR